ncbi:MAG: sodium-dependent transporter [Pseudomonadota bacterium]
MLQSATPAWSGRLAFVLASIGAAVGLGNIWKFPYTLGSSGGSAFVVIYVSAILLVATPIMLAEMMIGRRAAASAPTALAQVARDTGSSPRWSLLGWMGLFAVLLVLSFYSVIAGWTLAYLLKFVSGAMSGLDGAAVGANFGAFLADPLPMTLWHLLFTAITVAVIARGVRSGLERVVTVVMPALFLMLLGLVVYAGIAGDFGTALDFLFQPDFSQITAAVVLAAVGQAFFSVNVGVGTVLTFSAYLPRDVNLTRAAVTISLGDTLVALLAGLAIFPIVFANGLDPAQGPGLVYVTLSTAFAQMPGGTLVACAFFIMLFFAALSSSIAMLETLTAKLTERWPRPRAAATIGATTFVLGIVTVLSFSSWQDVYPLGGFAAFAGKTPFDLIDYLVSNLLMPLGGVGFALFAGWRLGRELQIAELGVGDGGLYQLWLLLVRFFAPLAVAVVLLFNLA